MAVSGAGGWKPSILVRIRNSELVTAGYTQNVPPSAVQMDMSVAADTLRANPTGLIRVDVKRLNDLRKYLRQTGHIRA